MAAASAARPVAALAATSVTVTSSPAGRVPQHFLGLSMEFRTVLAYAGQNPNALNPVFLQLMRNLTSGNSPGIRIGGESTDFTWWPVPHHPRPAGVRFDLDQHWMNVTRAMATALNSRLILGVNLMANNRRVASAETHAFQRRIGQRWIGAFELGNEPELYATVPWYHTPSGKPVLGRPPQTWTYRVFLHEFSTVSRALLGGPLAGPATGSAAWSALLGQFINDDPRTSLITLHEYPLKHCHASTQNTVSDVLADSSAKGLADYTAPFVALAHRRRRPVRIDEMSSITCGGQRGLSNSFATALWAVDAMYQMARIGVTGVNLHSTPGNPNELFSFTRPAGRWQAAVHPNYYGLLMFARAAPPGSRLLQVSASPKPLLTTWATRGPDRLEHVMLINKDTRSWRYVSVKVQDASSSATIQVLKAPRASSTGGVTLAGQSFGSETSTGLLTGHLYEPTVEPKNGAYDISLRPASATMLTLSTG